MNEVITPYPDSARKYLARPWSTFGGLGCVLVVLVLLTHAGLTVQEVMLQSSSEKGSVVLVSLVTVDE